MELVYKNEKPLFVIALVISILFWILLVVGTVGIALIYALFIYIGYLFAQSGFISYIKGTGVQVSEKQYPDLHERLMACCKKIGMEVPECYVLRTDTFNALATKFRGQHFIVLFSDVVDALKDDPDALNFYIGHELGHIHRKHLAWSVWLAPGKFLPLLGAAHSRACEYTCDRYGLACCDVPEAAQRGLLAIGAGNTRFLATNMADYIGQAERTGGFWMSFHELVGTYPWLVKRTSAVKALAEGREATQPSRNPVAGIFAFFVPNTGLGGAGAAVFIMMIAIIGILAAVAIPQYQKYTEAMQMSEAMSEMSSEEADSGGLLTDIAAANAEQLTTAVIATEPFRAVVEGFVANQKRLPTTAGELGAELPANDGEDADTQGFAISVENGGTLLVEFVDGDFSGEILRLVPSLEEQEVSWQCESDTIADEHINTACGG